MDTYLQSFKKAPNDSMDKVYAQYLPHGWPVTLIKALGDLYEYTLGLKSGQIIKFCSAEALSPDWVLLKYTLPNDFSFYEKNDFYKETINGFFYSRGIEVRVSEIAWVVDGYK